MRASIVAGCDAPPVREFGKEVLDLVALLVERLIIGIRHLLTARWDTGLDTLCLQGLPKGLAVISTVSNQCLGWRQGIQHETSTPMVAHLAFAEQHDDRPSLIIANGVQFGIQSAFGSPDTNIPFLSRLAAVRCAFRCMASIMMRSGLRPSPASAAKMRSNTPSRLQRMKRL